MLRWGATFQCALPVVAETWDGVLNDINGFHVNPRHVALALDAASSGLVTVDNVSPERTRGILPANGRERGGQDPSLRSGQSLRTLRMT